MKKFFTALLVAMMITSPALAYDQRFFDASGSPIAYTRAGVAKPNKLPAFFLGTWCGGFYMTIQR